MSPPNSVKIECLELKDGKVVVKETIYYSNVKKIYFKKQEEGFVVLPPDEWQKHITRCAPHWLTADQDEFLAKP